MWWTLWLGISRGKWYKWMVLSLHRDYIDIQYWIYDWIWLCIIYTVFDVV